MDTQELRKNLAETTISLNEIKRKKEMDEAEKKKSANEKLDTKLPLKETAVQVKELIKLEDEYLREGLLILSDLIGKRIG